MNTKNNTENAQPNRRNFLVNLSMAAAALTLNSAFGFPVETEQTRGKLFLKFDGINGIPIKDNMASFSETDLEKLKSGKMASLSLKLGISLDQRNWQSLNANITDRDFMEQLTEIAQKVK